MTKTREKSICRPGHICKAHCKKYPCFKGQDTLSSEFATTCHEFQQKDDWRECESKFYMENRKIFREVILKTLWMTENIEKSDPKLYSLIILGVNHGDHEAIFIKRRMSETKRREESIRKKGKSDLKA